MDNKSYFPCFQHSSTALNSGEPTGKYSILMLSSFLCRYSCTILDLCCVALSTKMTNFLNFFLACSRNAIKELPSNLSYCLNSCLPSLDSTPKTIVLLWDPVTVTIGLFCLIIHFLLIYRSCTNIDSSCTRICHSVLRLTRMFCNLF